MNDSPERPPRPASIWSRDFLLLWQGACVSAMGDQAFHIALVLWMKRATGSGTYVGAALFASGIASLLMPFGGVLADRFPRVRLLVLLDALSGTCVLILAALFLALPEQHPLLVPAVIGLSFLRSVFASLFHPVTNAVVPDLVPEESLGRANSLMRTTIDLVTVMGQSVAGLLFRVLGAPLLLLVDGVSFILSAITESFIREPERSHVDEQPRRLNVLDDLRAGFRYTGRIPGFRVYMLEAACANFCLAGLFVTLPFFVGDVLNLPEDWYGYLLAMMGLGAVLGAVLASRFPTPGVSRGAVQLVSMAALNGCMLPLSFARTQWEAALVMVPAWVGAGFHGVVLTTLVQRRTPTEIRGRVFGLLTTIRIGLIPIGMAVFGLLLDHPAVGPVRILFWTGSFGLVVLAIALLSPGFRWFFTGDEAVVHAE